MASVYNIVALHTCEQCSRPNLRPEARRGKAYRLGLLFSPISLWLAVIATEATGHDIAGCARCCFWRCFWSLAAPNRAGAADAPQATSLFGQPLYTPAPSPEALAKYQAAKADYEADPGNADKLIWYGRRAAYAGDFKEAIRIFSDGVRKFPQDARILRHRGHRYITTRQFDKAIADFEKAYALIAGKKDEIEPDGAPNARNIPLTTLGSNIRYHLGLAYYLKHDWKKALRFFGEEVRACRQ